MSNPPKKNIYKREEEGKCLVRDSKERERIKAKSKTGNQEI